MTKKEFNAEEKEKFYKKRYVIIGKIRKLEQLVREIRRQGGCRIKPLEQEFCQDLEFKICDKDLDIGNKLTGFDRFIEDALEAVKNIYIEKFEELEGEQWKIH